MNILTVERGGTTSKYAIVNNNGKIIKKYDPIKSQLGHDLKWLFDYIKTIKEDYAKISICVPGFYNPVKKMIIVAGNLQYYNFKILEECQKYTNKKIIILNDANAAGLGEYWKLAIKNPEIKNVLLYTIGTGVGGAVILNGKLHEGSNGYAGEFGHGGNFQNDVSCTCGINNCLEPKSSAFAIIKLINHYAQSNLSTILNQRLTQKKQALEFVDVIDLIQNNDYTIINLIKESLKPLIEHISIMIYAFNPDVIIIGGGFSSFGIHTETLIKNELSKIVAPFLLENLEVKNAENGNDAAFLGCAYQGFINEA